MNIPGIDIGHGHSEQMDKFSGFFIIPHQATEADQYLIFFELVSIF